VIQCRFPASSQVVGVHGCRQQQTSKQVLSKLLDRPREDHPCWADRELVRWMHHRPVASSPGSRRIWVQIAHALYNA
jgi:hypothetical protein